MIEFIGWIGAGLLAVCSVPQAIQCYRQGHANGLSTMMIWLWGAGMAVTFVYVLSKCDWPLVMNYGFSLVVVWLPIVWYKYKPRAQKSPSREP